MIKKMLTIGNVETLKSGSSPKTGKPWTLFKVQVSDPDRELEHFTTFQDKYESLTGQKIAVFLNKEINGKFTNWKEENGSPKKGLDNEILKQIADDVSAIRKMMESSRRREIDEESL